MEAAENGIAGTAPATDSVEDRCPIPKENRVIEDKTKLRREMEHFVELVRKMPTLAALEPRVERARSVSGLRYTGLVALYNMAMELLNEELTLLAGAPIKSQREMELEKALSARKSMKELDLEKAFNSLSDAHTTLQEDFNRFRARANTEQESMVNRANEDLLHSLVPVADNFNRALTASESATNVTAVLDGIRMIHRQFQDVLTQGGLVPIPTHGQPFDPNIHEVLMEVETTDVPAGAICEEVQCGYYLAGKVFRPALVKVARAASEG